MAASNYDVNVQLVLATTAEAEGDLESARAFLEEAERIAYSDRVTSARVRSCSARFLARHVRMPNARSRSSFLDRMFAFNEHALAT